MNVRYLGFALIALVAFAAFSIADDLCLFDRGIRHESVVSRAAVSTGVDDTPVRLAALPEREEVMLDETFAVRPGELLQIENAHSDVVIEAGSGSEARVRITLSAESMDRARAFYEHLNFEVEKSGRTLSVISNPRGSWNGSSGGADIDIFITVPNVFDADVSTRHGDVYTSELKGALRFDVAHGDLEAGTLSGSLLNISAAHGDVEAKRLASEKVRVHVQHGDAEFDAVTAMEAEVEAQHGDVEIEDVTASEIAVTTQHGDIAIRRLDGYPEISAAHGDIDVYLANAKGGAFSSHHGNIHLTAEPDSPLDLDLSASDIDIATQYEFQGRQQRDRIVGSVNGGGPKLAARSTHGHIRLRAN